MGMKFFDRLGNCTPLSYHEGETAGECLVRHKIPPSSVLVTSDETIISDSVKLNTKLDYECRLIEGYDIQSILMALKSAKTPEGLGAFDVGYLLAHPDGAIEGESAALSIDELEEHVITTVVDTILQYKLISSGDRILVGLSGGVDSSSLLLLLNSARSRLPDFDLVAVTYEDFDSRESPTFVHAHALAKKLNVEHHVAPATMVEEAFKLNTKLDNIFPELMKTESASKTMYIDHHTTRRGLELFAEANEINKIALGLHTTDLMAGLLNAFATGYSVGSLPLRKVGDVEYIYPLSFVSKRQLHLFHYQVTGTLARHTNPNEWEQNPLDRNLYYYIADMLQEYWPGCEVPILNSHNWRLRRQSPLQTEVCSNCGSTLIIQPFMPAGEDECEACQVLRKHGYIS